MNPGNRFIGACIAFGVLMYLSVAKADQLFESDETLELSVSGPLLAIKSDRDKTMSYPGVLTAGGDTFDVSLRVRGNKRLDPDTCRNPPLWIDFESETIKKSLFAHQKKIKLVVLCKDTGRYRDYLRSEFLVYRLFNLLTPLSYKVRWLEVNFVDEQAASRSEPAFFIERKPRLAKRNGLQSTNVSEIEVSELEPRSSALVSLFQYVISNADYSLVSSADDSCCHNAKILIGDDSQYRPVIYDFDSSGLVNTKYAVPNPTLGIKKVTRRLYRGYCAHNSELNDAREELLGMRPGLLALLETDPVIAEKPRKRMVKYFTRSLDMIGDDDTWQKKILDKCRG